MLILTCLLLGLASAFMLLLPLELRRREIYRRYSGSCPVACPENQQAAVVNIDLRHAAETGIDGVPRLRLCDCTRWPERMQCDQSCMPEAAQAGAGEASEPQPKAKQIYHLPIALAAFAAWCLGALWHSQYVFRARWADAFGLSHADVKQIVWWLSPHLLTAAMCLLFAYGVAWLLALSHRKGVLQGVLMAVLLCGAVLAATGYALARLPHGLLTLEAGYIGLATLTVGSIVGGLYNRVLLPAD